MQNHQKTPLMLIDFAEACEKLKFSPIYIEINARFQLLMHLKHFLVDCESFLYNTNATFASNIHKKTKILYFSI